MNYCLCYKKLNFDDKDIRYITEIHKLPEIEKYISIDYSNYFYYVTNTDNVFYYKVFYNKTIVGTIHIEISNSLLSLWLLVIPELQGKGFGTQMLNDIINNKLGLTFTSIQAYNDESNTISLKLFEKAGFVQTLKTDELIEVTYNVPS